MATTKRKNTKKKNTTEQSDDKKTDAKKAAQPKQSDEQIVQETSENIDIEASSSKEAFIAEEAEKARIAEEKRLADEAEKARIAEEKRLADEAEKARIAEEKRLADEAAKRAKMIESKIKEIAAKEATESIKAEIAELKKRQNLAPTCSCDEKDRVPTAIKIAIICFFILAAIILKASFDNSNSYYLCDTSRGLDIWQGDFSPMSKSKIASLEGLDIPDAMKQPYKKEEVFPIPFNYYLDKADAIINAGYPFDFDKINSYIDKASEFISKPEDKFIIEEYIQNIKAAQGFVQNANIAIPSRALENENKDNTAILPDHSEMLNHLDSKPTESAAPLVDNEKAEKEKVETAIKEDVKAVVDEPAAPADKEKVETAIKEDVKAVVDEPAAPADKEEEEAVVDESAQPADKEEVKEDKDNAEVEVKEAEKAEEEEEEEETSPDTEEEKAE
ncbi:MAG: hypothetical protein HQK71_09815 [Desulfamplus sp.]|nr:hypothetical protein [Desulfamplus sp.]